MTSFKVQKPFYMIQNTMECGGEGRRKGEKALSKLVTKKNNDAILTNSFLFDLSSSNLLSVQKQIFLSNFVYLLIKRLQIDLS